MINEKEAKIAIELMQIEKDISGLLARKKELVKQYYSEVDRRLDYGRNGFFYDGKRLINQETGEITEETE